MHDVGLLHSQGGGGIYEGGVKLLRKCRHVGRHSTTQKAEINNV